MALTLSQSFPSKIAPQRVLVVLVLILGTFLLLQGVSGAHRTPINQPLVTFPRMLGDWQVKSSCASTEAVIKMLGIDDYVEYNYSAPTGQPFNFYAAFYKSVDNGGSYHSPKNCIPGGGWEIDAVKTVEIQPRSGQAPVTLFLFDLPFQIA